ncbi:MAG TPA: cysteine hydrolase [Devosia sp.]|nr:cysteine hydrolase [Devosia sp.]
MAEDGFELGDNCAHICVDVQRMFIEPTPWQTDWMSKVLPAIEAIADAHAPRTVFTRFITAASPEVAAGAWQQYYRRWRDMTQDRMPSEMLALAPSLARYVPPAHLLDKSVYSPWFNTDLHHRLRNAGVDTLVVSGGETEICVLATVLGAIDHGYRIVLPTDALCSSADETHDAMLRIYESRFGMQLAACTTQAVLDRWRS